MCAGVCAGSVHFGSFMEAPCTEDKCPCARLVSWAWVMQLRNTSIYRIQVLLCKRVMLLV